MICNQFQAEEHLTYFITTHNNKTMQFLIPTKTVSVHMYTTVADSVRLHFKFQPLLTRKCQDLN